MPLFGILISNILQDKKWKFKIQNGNKKANLGI